MIYLHGSDARQQEVASTLSKLAREKLKQGSDRRSVRLGHGQSGTRRTQTESARRLAMRQRAIRFDTRQFTVGRLTRTARQA